jgi:hypothetical protein
MSLSALLLGLWMGAAPAAGSEEVSRRETAPSAGELARCHEDLTRVLDDAARFGSVQRRAQALLAGLFTACEGVLPARLREGAGEAASTRQAERSRLLLEAARDFVPGACLGSEGARARDVEARCPPPEDTLFERPLPEFLDVGSYAFALAVRARLREGGPPDARAQRWVAEFLLRASLEGEAAASRGARPSD